MKYVITWRERQASSEEHEAARKRILEIFKDWKMPVGCKIDRCLARAGEFGGFIILETDSLETDTLGRFLHPVFDRLDPHLLGEFQFKVEPVVDVTDSVMAFVSS